MVRRRKLIPVTAGTYLLYQLPEEVNVDQLHFIHDTRRLVLADEGECRLDITEHSPSPRF